MIVATVWVEGTPQRIPSPGPPILPPPPCRLFAAQSNIVTTLLQHCGGVVAMRRTQVTPIRGVVDRRGPTRGPGCTRK